MKKLAEGVKKEFSNVRFALEEHLTAINENTSEIQSLFDYLQEMENKIEKLSQRLDMFQLENAETPLEDPTITPLNHTEKKVFLTLYTEELPLSYPELSAKARLPLSIIPETVANLASKGIPLLRSFVNNQLFVKISPTFKEKQAKENLINLSLESFM